MIIFIKISLNSKRTFRLNTIDYSQILMNQFNHIYYEMCKTGGKENENL